MNAPGEARRPGEELQPGELLRALGIGGDTVGAEEGRRGADGAARPTRGRRTVAAMAAAAAVCAGIAAGFRAGEAGRLAESSKFAANSPAATATAGSVEIQGDSSVKTRKFGKAAVRGAAVAASLIGGAQAGDAVQWRVEDGGNGHWYRFDTFANPTPWQTARQASERDAGYLACVTSAAEQSFLIAIAPNYQDESGGQAWLGGYQDTSAADFSEPHGGWRWVSGEQMTYLGWYNAGTGWGADFMTLAKDIDGNFGWNDLWTDYSGGRRFAFTEWSADCNSDGIVDYGQIRDGTFADANTNGVPDLCECATHPELGACRCAGDVVNDGTVNGADLGTLLAYWGPTTSGAFSQASDINDDGRVDGSDLGVLLANWGPCQYSGASVPPWATLIEALPDPAVVTDPALRTAIAATGLAWRVRDTGTGIEMLLVPPGTFQMGCSASESWPCSPSELPNHSVTITNAFYLGRYEVSQNEWQLRTGANPSYFQYSADSPQRAVEQVSWSDAQAFAAGAGLRLPTEAEWEFACRAGSTAAFYNGSNDDATLGGLAWIESNANGEIRPVGGKQPNDLGLHDMLGNVWEWVGDWYGTYPSGPQTNPAGPTTGSDRVCRGHTWGASYNNVRSSARDWGHPQHTKHSWTGFRVARNP